MTKRKATVKRELDLGVDGLPYVEVEPVARGGAPGSRTRATRVKNEEDQAALLQPDDYKSYTVKHEPFDPALLPKSELCDEDRKPPKRKATSAKREYAELDYADEDDEAYAAGLIHGAQQGAGEYAPGPSSSAASSRKRAKAEPVAAALPVEARTYSNPAWVQVPGIPGEKRQGRARNSCPKNILERLERVIAQRFYLINREKPDPTNALLEQFGVLGSTGNVYTVRIGHVPYCSCPDASKGNTCKHILFCMLKVLCVPAHSPNIYQKALLTSELDEVFGNAPAAANEAVQNDLVTQAFLAASQPGGSASASTSALPATLAGKRRPIKEDDTCPVCFEDIYEERDQSNNFVYCELSCGNVVHRECFQTAARAKVAQGQPVTCIYCRADWPKSGPMAVAAGGGAGAVRKDEGYLNLGQQLGISPERDTSSYYHGVRQGLNPEAAYYAASKQYSPGSTAGMPVPRPRYGGYGGGGGRFGGNRFGRNRYY